MSPLSMMWLHWRIGGVHPSPHPCPGPPWFFQSLPCSHLVQPQGLISTSGVTSCVSYDFFLHPPIVRTTLFILGRYSHPGINSLMRSRYPGTWTMQSITPGKAESSSTGIVWHYQSSWKTHQSQLPVEMSFIELGDPLPDNESKRSRPERHPAPLMSPAFIHENNVIHPGRSPLYGPTGSLWFWQGASGVY